VIRPYFAGVPMFTSTPLVATKPSPTKHEQSGYHKDHEDYENCNDSGARRTASIVCHLFSS
jgi:hypothetical protein